MEMATTVSLFLFSNKEAKLHALRKLGRLSQSQQGHHLQDTVWFVRRGEQTGSLAGGSHPDIVLESLE